MKASDGGEVTELLGCQKIYEQLKKANKDARTASYQVCHYSMLHVSLLTFYQYYVHIVTRTLLLFYYHNPVLFYTS